MLIATSYLPPIWYFSKLILSDKIIIDTHEHFIKQTIRNRCHILSPNGVQQLIVPVAHNNRTQKPVKEIMIANDHRWQQQHWRSLEACYRRSAYYEFYVDDFAPIYKTQFDYLIDFNTELLKLIFELLNIKKEVAFTESFVPYDTGIENDFRTKCVKGNPSSPEGEREYPQVFGFKNGFVPGLSIIDLLFNTGPAAVDYLKM